MNHNWEWNHLQFAHVFGGKYNLDNQPSLLLLPSRTTGWGNDIRYSNQKKKKLLLVKNFEKLTNEMWNVSPPITIGGVEWLLDYIY